jgi:hypothetical protein
MLSRAIGQQNWGKPRRRPTLSQRGIMTIPVGKMYPPGPGITDQIPESRLYPILAVSTTRFNAAFS